MININELQEQVDLLDLQIKALEGTRFKIQCIIALERNKTYEKYIPIIEKYLDVELSKEEQSKLWEELNRNKIHEVIRHLEGYNMEYKKVTEDNWKHMIITKKENENNDTTGNI